MKSKAAVLFNWLLVGTLIFGLIGCNNPTPSSSAVGTTSNVQPEKTALEVWTLETTPQRVEAYQDVISGFKSKNSNVEVELKVINWADAFPKLLTSIQSGIGPDVVQCSPDITITVKELGVVQPLDDIVAEIKSEYGLYDAPIVPYTYDGHTWAVPVWTQSMMLYYRADLLKEKNITPPETWDELLVAAEELTTDGRFGIGIPTSKHMYADQVFYSFLTTAGADIYDKAGDPIINSAETINTLDFYKKLATFAPKDASSWTWAESEQALAADKIAMTVAFGNVLERAYNDSPEIAKNIESVTIPMPDGGQLGTISYSIGLMCLAQNENEIKASKDFIKYSHNPEVNAAWLNKMAAGCFLPATEDTAKSSAFLSNDIVSTFDVAIKNEISASQNGKLFGFTSDFPVTSIGSVTGANVISEMAQKVVFGNVDSTTAANEAQAKIIGFQ